MMGYSKERFILTAIFLIGSMSIIFCESPPQQMCPEQNMIAPCVCTVKKNGLDILCEATDLQHISVALSVLKGKSPIIFYLKLRHNNLPKLQGFIFLALDIRHLTIHNSSLAAIEENALSSLGKGLTQLDVSLNMLKNVPSMSFKNLHRLLILNLNHNKILTVHDNAFGGLATLEILTLYENKINAVESEAFKGVEKKLKRLNLGGNELISIPKRAFSILNMLKKLEIQENKISHIEEGDFSGLENLDSLILAHNIITWVPAKVFSNLKYLNSLELEGNKIKWIETNAFQGLEENLQYLRLGDNQLSEIPSQALRPLHRLRHLDLRNNNISYVTDDVFTGYGDSLTFLNLQKNGIKILPAMIFENLNSLEALNIQNNKLTRIPEEIMEPLLDTLKIIDITDNPLLCSCELIWFPNLLQDLKDRDDEMTQKKKPLCHMPIENREYYIQNMPLEKMNCAGQNISPSASREISGVMKTILQAYIFWNIMVFRDI